MSWVLVIAALAACVTLAFSSKLLLAWYVYEARRQPVTQDPSDAVITYPLA